MSCLEPLNGLYLKKENFKIHFSNSSSLARRTVLVRLARLELSERYKRKVRKLLHERYKRGYRNSGAA